MNLLRLLRPFWLQLCLALGFSVLPALAQAWLPGWVVRPLFDQVLAGQFERLNGVLWVGAGLLGVLVISGYILEAFMGYLSVKVPAYWREQVFSRLLATDLTAVPASAGGLAGRIVADLRELESFIFFGLGTFFAQGLTLLAIVAQLFLRYTQLTLYLLLILPLMIGLLVLVGRWVSRYSHQTQSALGRMAARMSEGFGRLELIQALNLGPFAKGRFEQANQAQYRMARARALVSALNLPLGQLITTLLLGILLALGVGRVQQGQMTTGDLTAFLTLLALAITPIQTLGRVGVLYAQGEGAAKRVVELLELPQAPKGGSLRPETLRGSYELKEVSFAYQSETTLEQINLAIPAGSFVALVGSSGSGKSTLLRLLLGLYPPSLGQVLLDGHGLSSYDLGWFRSQIAWVPQEPLLFAGTLADNLRALAPGAGEKAMLDALEQVGLSTEVQLQTALEDEGGGLSVGQKQRLAIAAALLRGAKVMLLDEITSALDRNSEAQITAALERAREGRTLVAVAHRLSTVQNADLIVVMERGRIAEMGQHADLLAKNGLYAGLWRG